MSDFLLQPIFLGLFEFLLVDMPLLALLVSSALQFDDLRYFIIYLFRADYPLILFKQTIYHNTGCTVYPQAE
jgi:hypothetical protein